MCGTYKFWFSQITNSMISMESNNGKIPYSQNFRLRETCWQALFGNTQTATVSVCCEWKSQGKGSVSSSGECDHHASREKLRAQQLSVLAALLTLRLTAVTPPCQQSLVPGALTGGDHMLLSPSGNRGSCSSSTTLFHGAVSLTGEGIHQQKVCGSAQCFAAQPRQASLKLLVCSSALALTWLWRCVQHQINSHLLALCLLCRSQWLPGSIPESIFLGPHRGCLLCVMFGIQFLDIIMKLEVLKRCFRAVWSCKGRYLNHHCDWDCDLQCWKNNLPCWRGETKLNA